MMVAARIVNIALGLWLYVASFIWPHTAGQFLNAWLVGLAIVTCASLTMVAPRTHYVTLAVAAWLFISAFVLPSASGGARWDSVVVAILVFLFSLVPARQAELADRPLSPLPPRVA